MESFGGEERSGGTQLAALSDIFKCVCFGFSHASVPEAVDQVVSPVHFFGHSKLRHVHLSIDVLQAVLEVLRQTVDCTVGQGGVDGVERRKTDVLQICSAVQILRPELNVLQNVTAEAASVSALPS